MAEIQIKAIKAPVDRWQRKQWLRTNVPEAIQLARHHLLQPNDIEAMEVLGHRLDEAVAAKKAGKQAGKPMTAQRRGKAERKHEHLRVLHWAARYLGIPLDELRGALAWLPHDERSLDSAADDRLALEMLDRMLGMMKQPQSTPRYIPKRRSIPRYIPKALRPPVIEEELPSPSPEEASPEQLSQKAINIVFAGLNGRAYRDKSGRLWFKSAPGSGHALVPPRTRQQTRQLRF